ncbi:MAG: mechanosensitive ion channel, partial [Thermoanaerobaculia bacterium]|nr:mechanosensitive ion channel [Thermoanaerobaculia bacterium]
RGTSWCRDVLRILLLVAFFLLAATQVLGLELSAVLVSSTVLSAVIGLALQDVLGNVFAGMALQLEQPFATGDWLEIEGTLARVVEMSWRATRLRTNEGIALIEPNASIAGARLTNYGSGEQPVAFNFHVGVAYSAPPAVVKAALREAARQVRETAASPAPEAFVEGFGDSAVLYRMRVWTHEVAAATAFRDAIYSRIWYQLQRRGLEIPFPIRTVHLHPPQEQQGDTAVEARFKLLSRIDLFKDFAPERLRRLAQQARRELYDDGENLVREGEQGDSLFVVDTGRAIVTKSGLAGSTSGIELAVLGPGDFFGEMSLLTGEPRSASVSSDGSCAVLVLAKDAIEPLMQEDPELAAALSRVLAARRLDLEHRLEDRRSRGTQEQLATEASLLQRIRGFFKLG